MCERARHVNIIEAQHTVAADRAVPSGTHLRLVVEAESCLSAAHSPAAAAPDTMSTNIARNRAVEPKSSSVDLTSERAWAKLAWAGSPAGIGLRDLKECGPMWFWKAFWGVSTR